MNLVKFFIMTNIIIISATFVIAPMFIYSLEFFTQCNYCSPEKQEQLQNIINKAKWQLYIFPPIFTNLTIFSIIMIKNWQHKQHFNRSVKQE